MVTENTDQPTEDVAQTQPAEVETTNAESSTAPVQFTTEQQAQINKMVAQTKRETRQQFADYSDLKTRAARRTDQSYRSETISEVEQQDPEYQSRIGTTCCIREADGTTTRGRSLHGFDRRGIRARTLILICG